jgi:hypothetical protein
MASLVHGAIKIDPRAAYPEVGLVDSPGAIGAPAKSDSSA